MTLDPRMRSVFSERQRRIRWHAAMVLVAACTVAGWPAAVHAQRGKRKPPSEPGVRVSLVPLGDPRHPYRYKLALELSTWESADVVADRRLLQLRLKSPGKGPSRTCVDESAPTRADSERIVRLDKGQRWQEWVDLRMLCWGRNLETLNEGATFEVAYGFRAKGSDRWVARLPVVEEVAAAAEATAASKGSRKSKPVKKGRASKKAKTEAWPLLRGDDAEFQRPAPPTKSSQPGPVVVSMEPAEAGDSGGLTFEVSLRSSHGTVVVYPRFDLWRFQVRGPEGEKQCRQHRTVVVPIIDFYSKVSDRRGWTERYDAALYCKGRFAKPGIYEVVPIVDLLYGGERYGLKNVVKGTFTGEPVPVRVPLGDVYIAQPIEEAKAPVTK